MSVKNVKLEVKCPFTGRSVEDAFGEEVSLFIHCHLRGYDQNGIGVQMDASYYDKYGAPVKKDDSWTEGYHAVEMKLADHFNICETLRIFPLVAGMGGGAHLYRDHHKVKPWNWTGWIPMQNKWLCEGQFFSNRYFLSIRGNEIQNNLWNYNPQHEHEHDDGEEYSQIEPTDKYRGGYFFEGNPFARYLHIMSLKSHLEDGNKRYNYIVHPLAYRSSMDTLPDDSVDAMQWDIINIVKEKHFGQGEDWGEKVHGLEIFNDFTFYQSYLPIEKDALSYNGELASSGPTEGDATGHSKSYFTWHNTYALEYAEFLLDSSLTRGVHLQTLCANDAFYQRKTTRDGKSDKEAQVLLADPKGYIPHNSLKQVKGITPHFAKTKAERMIGDELLASGTDPARLGEIKEFLNELPYRFKTVFGYVTIIDTDETLRKTVFDREKKGAVPGAGLDDGGLLAMDYLREGRFYSSTGVHDLFNYKSDSQRIPYEIKDQPHTENLCYEITTGMQLIFTFAKCKKRNADLIWRYSITYEVPKEKQVAFETAYGYFKLSESKKTVLDLSLSYATKKVKWLYFVAIDPNNPMRRAWFSAIRGLAFGKPQCDEKEFIKLHPVLQHKIYTTIKDTATVHVNVKQDQEVKVSSVKSFKLGFQFSTKGGYNEDYIYAYFMQANSLQQDLHLEGTKESSKVLPPRYLQNVHGYFPLNKDHGTRINMSNSWDEKTVDEVYFYQIDKNGKPEKISSEPVPFPA